jgi:hypothetical protein
MMQMEDSHYMNKTYCRWTEHREGIYSDENVLAIIDSCVQVLGDAADRNFARFPTLGNYVWPAIEPYPETYEGEIDKLKTWLLGRLEWMDGKWLNMGNCNTQGPTVSAESIKIDASTFALYPNPSTDNVQIASSAIGNSTVIVQLIDMSGKVLHAYEGQLQEINLTLSENSRSLDQGVYFVRIEVAGQSSTKKFIKL